MSELKDLYAQKDAAALAIKLAEAPYGERFAALAREIERESGLYVEYVGFERTSPAGPIEADVLFVDRAELDQFLAHKAARKK